MASTLLSTLQSYPELLLAISSFLLLFFLHYYLHILHRRSLNLPAKFPILGDTPHIFLHLHHLHDWFTDLLRSTGCTFLLQGPIGSLFDVVVTCDPANVNHVFNTNFLNYPKGDDFAEIFDFLGNGIFNSDKDSWKFQRKKAHSLMSTPKFRSHVLASTNNKVAKTLIPFLEHFENKTLDLQDVFLRLSFDNTCSFVLGVDPGCLQVGFPTVPFAAAMDDAEEAAFFRQIVPVTWWKILRWFNVGPERKLAEAVAVMDEFINGYIAKRREEKRGGANLLSSYIDSDQSEIGNNVTGDIDRFLRDTVLNLMVAGRDTISSALTWFFYLIAKNPTVEAKILDEIQTRGLEDLGRLVYLHAAVCESLRLYPPVPFEHKGVVNPDTLPSGAAVHQNRRVLFSLYAMGRMEVIWGKDCLEFKPERWISPETGRVRHEPSYKFFAFNAGPRTCLGRDVAFTQLKAVAAAVIQRFRVSVLEGFVARPKVSIILYMDGGLMVKVSKREDC